MFPEDDPTVETTFTNALGLFDRARGNSPISGDNYEWNYEDEVENLREQIRSGNIRDAIRSMSGLPSDAGEHDLPGGALFDVGSEKQEECD